MSSVSPTPTLSALPCLQSSDRFVTSIAAPSSDAERRREEAADDRIVDLIQRGDTASAVTIMLYEFQHLLTVMRLPQHQQRRVLFESLGLLNLNKVTVDLGVVLPPQLVIPNDSECHWLISQGGTKFFDATRLTPQEFMLLYSELGMYITQSRRSLSHDLDAAAEHTRRHVHRVLPPCDQLLLWFYHSDGNDNDLIAHLFRINTRSVDRVADHVTQVINTVWTAETAWPTLEERRALYGFFSVHEKAVALMDGTHCRLSVPLDHGQEHATFSGYKKYHTQNYLICINALGLVIFIDGPHAGRGTDRKIYKRSVFAAEVCPLLEAGEYIIADGGFIGPGPDRLLVPFKAPTIAAAATAREKQERTLFNEELTMNRSRVEHVIHFVKNRAQSLALRYPRERRKQGDIFYAAARFANRIKRLRMDYQLSVLQRPTT